MNNDESSWQDSIKNAIRSHEQLEDFFAQKFVRTKYPIFIPQALARRIKSFGIGSPLAKQFLPQEEENHGAGLIDPIGDHAHSPVSQIVHRYKNRLLFFPTQICPVQCRYCFRKNELHQGDELFKNNLQAVRQYIQHHDEVEEVIFSGGDPLMLSNSKLSAYFDEFLRLKIPMLRLHTRMPVITPARLDDEFYELLKKYAKEFSVFTVAIHLNHEDEITPELAQRMQRFRSLNVQWLAQTVLLKGVNDRPECLKNLFLGLLKLGIKPYYLHHPDLVRGAMHFWLSIEEGRRLYAKLRDELPGHALPQYVVDLPGGHGKTPVFNPESYEFSGRFLSKDGSPIEYSPVQ